MEYIEVNGQPLPVPAEAIATGPEAVHQWFTEQDAPYAQALLAKEGVRAKDVTPTGFGGVILTSDVERAVLAREAAKAAKASEVAATPAAPSTPDAPKEG